MQAAISTVSQPAFAMGMYVSWCFGNAGHVCMKWSGAKSRGIFSKIGVCDLNAHRTFYDCSTWFLHFHTAQDINKQTPWTNWNPTVTIAHSVSWLGLPTTGTSSLQFAENSGRLNKGYATLDQRWFVAKCADFTIFLVLPLLPCGCSFYVPFSWPKSVSLTQNFWCLRFRPLRSNDIKWCQMIKANNSEC